MTEAVRNIPGATVEVPADSTLGQWHHQLATALMTPTFLEWARREGIELRSIVLYPVTDNLSAMVNGSRRVFSSTANPEIKPALAAAKVLIGGHLEAVHYSDAFSMAATVETVAQFYNVAHGSSGYQALWQNGSFPAIEETDTGRSAAVRGETALAEQRNALAMQTSAAQNVQKPAADPQYLADLAGFLRHIAKMSKDSVFGQAVMRGQMSRRTQMPNGETRSLGQELNRLGFLAPGTVEGLNALADKLDQQSSLTGRARGDRQLARGYIHAIGINLPGTLIDVPADSTLGEWRDQLARALNGPKLLAWAHGKGIDLTSIVLHPNSDSFTARVNNVLRTYTLNDDSGFAAVGRPAMAAAKVLASGAIDDINYVDALSGKSSVEVVRAFYMPREFSDSSVNELRRYGRFPAIRETQTDRSPEVRGETALAAQRQSLQSTDPSLQSANPTEPTLAAQTPPPASTANGEWALVAAYTDALSRLTRGDRVVRVNIPVQSKLGEWLEVYRAHLEKPAVKAWMRDNQITEPLSINPDTATLTATINGVEKSFNVNDGSGWRQISTPILAIAKIIAPAPNQNLTVSFSASAMIVDVKVVSGFYGDTSSNSSERIAHLNRNQAFDPIAPDDPLRPADQRSEQALDRHKLALFSNVPSPTHSPTSAFRKLDGDLINLQNLASEVEALATSTEGRSVPELLIKERLANKRLIAHPNSALGDGEAVWVNLATLIRKSGFELPKTQDEVASLAQRLTFVANTPPLQNLGGALSWPIPMSPEDQRKTLLFFRASDTGLAGLPLQGGGENPLSYLISGSTLTEGDFNNPAHALNALLDTPRAKALGLALQNHLNGVSSDVSVYDYLLAAIQLGLNPNALNTGKSNEVAGFDLSKPEHWGERPVEVVDRLSRHLVTSGRAPSSAVALASHLLLARAAPQFLVRDIPKEVTIGSSAWVQLTIAAAKLEDHSPGRVPGMTYTEVLIAANAITAETDAVKSATQDALREWGVINGVLADAASQPSPPEIEKVRTAFNNQLTTLKNTSMSLQTPLPTRKETALNRLKEQFPTLDPAVFESKAVSYRRQSGGRTYAWELVKHSMLDIEMEGKKLEADYTLASTDSRVPLEAFTTYVQSNSVGDSVRLFNQQFKEAITAKGAGHREMAKYLISNLPVSDRKNFEFGKVEFFHTNEYAIGANSSSPPVLQKRGHTMVVKTTLNNDVNIYVIDTHSGTINKRNGWRSTFTAPYTADKMNVNKSDAIARTVLFDPDEGARANDSAEKTMTSTTPNSYGSSRTAYIADVFEKSLALNSADILNQAQGLTTFDQGRKMSAVIDNFILDLIPFRSAIVSFMNGNVGEGVVGLTLDVFGFLTAGLGKVVQITNAAGKTVNALGKITRASVKASKFIGAGLIGSLNPLSGTGSLLVGGGKLIGKGFNSLRGATGSYDLLKAVSRTNGVAATGTYKLGEQAIESGAVLSNGKWYAYDPITVRPYGPPLSMFNAKSIAMGGEMQNFRVLDNGLGMSEDMTKRGLRLTLDAHGVIPPGQSTALMNVNGSLLTPNEVVDLLKAHNIDMSKYTEIRLTMCHSGTGAGQSFSAQLSKLTHKPTEGFLGVMYGGDELEDVAARMFKNGGAKQREYIDQAINGQKKKVVKYKMTTLTADGRGLYTVSPDYNPVRFDAAGVPMAPKPLRTPYAAAKVNLSAGERRTSNVDLSEYDDLT
jgi:hypothetical protein